MLLDTECQQLHNDNMLWKLFGSEVETTRNIAIVGFYVFDCLGNSIAWEIPQVSLVLVQRNCRGDYAEAGWKLSGSSSTLPSRGFSE